MTNADIALRTFYEWGGPLTGYDVHLMSGIPERSTSYILRKLKKEGMVKVVGEMPPDDGEGGVQYIYDLTADAKAKLSGHQRSGTQLVEVNAPGSGLA